MLYFFHVAIYYDQVLYLALLLKRGFILTDSVLFHIFFQ